ncbi:MAG: glycoside hydrolase family protein [Candidatus Brevundimonas colombiensis]|uniref:Lysozyme n=1 Tax=Candidatus Brevundimonas colombiensis TaxID=3121376 RepID=A0AAJ5WZV7_9CAUL|nr:glycoside hydrolase family protein [Brevundimonas sp.]WEK39578.1 MAG: glycoside hydrolase family protein [Brevundimonas sp.]
MSDVLAKPTRVSREGVLLIKSFEGFRHRAGLRSDGRWVIGYGHTRSAREGATVSEAEAELLMQYDLLPVVKAVVDHVKVPLNQHQFDALASFAFSIGAERFASSDVVAQLNAGSARQAAATMSAWADEAAAEKPTRRRSAEHALFNAAPGAPVTLADLLAAPLPSPFETPQTALPAVDGALDEAVAPFPVAEATHAAKTVGPLADVAPLASQAVETVPIVAANDAHEPLVGAPTKTAPAEYAPAEASSVVLTAPGLATQSLAAPVQADPALTALDPDFTPPDQALGVRDTLARAKASRRAGLGELVTFLAMGALGMVSLGVAAAAFQRASATRSGDTATVAWVLALIAVACIGVSAYNLYRRWGRPDRG